MIVLDASVLIAHLDGNDLHHARAEALLESSGATPLGASAITLAETVVAPARAGRLEEATTALRRIGVTELGTGTDSARNLAELRAETSLKLPDCCVLLAAREHDGVVASFDDDLLQNARDIGLKTVD